MDSKEGFEERSETQSKPTVNVSWSVQGNEVQLTGKVSRTGKLGYSPRGTAFLEFTVAAPQLFLDERAVGYFEVVASGHLAEERAGAAIIGKTIKVTGNLWSRSYRDRKGRLVKETKIFAQTLEGVNQ